MAGYEDGYQDGSGEGDETKPKPTADDWMAVYGDQKKKPTADDWMAAYGDKPTTKPTTKPTSKSTSKPTTGLDVASILDDEWAKLGWQPNARMAMLANVGRENDWNPSTIFNEHIDPASNTNGRGIIRNRGVISWNDKRRDALEKFVKDNGGDFTESESNLRLQARFLDQEARTGKWGNIADKISDPNLAVDDYYPVFQKYILYQPRYEYDNKRREQQLRDRGFTPKQIEQLKASGDDWMAAYGDQKNPTADDWMAVYGDKPVGDDEVTQMMGEGSGDTDTNAEIEKQLVLLDKAQTPKEREEITLKINQLRNNTSIVVGKTEDTKPVSTPVQDEKQKEGKLTFKDNNDEEWEEADDQSNVDTAKGLRRFINPKTKRTRIVEIKEGEQLGQIWEETTVDSEYETYATEQAAAGKTPLTKDEYFEQQYQGYAAFEKKSKRAPKSKEEFLQLVSKPSLTAVEGYRVNSPAVKQQQTTVPAQRQTSQNQATTQSQTVTPTQTQQTVKQVDSSAGLGGVRQDSAILSNNGRYGSTLVKTDKDFLGTVAGTVDVDTSKKPSGMSYDEFVFRSALQTIGGRFGITPQQINDRVAEAKSKGFWKNGQSLNDKTKWRNPDTSIVTAIIDYGTLNETLGGSGDSLTAEISEARKEDELQRYVLRRASKQTDIPLSEISSAQEDEARRKTEAEIRKDVGSTSFGEVAQDVLGLATKTPIAFISDWWNTGNPVRQDELSSLIPKTETEFNQKVNSRMGEAYKDFGSFYNYKSQVLDMDWSETVNRTWMNYLRSTINQAASSNFKGLDVVDSLLESISPFKIISSGLFGNNSKVTKFVEDYNPSLRNFENLVNYVAYNLSGEKDKQFQWMTQNTPVQDRMFYTLGKGISDTLGEDKTLKRSVLGTLSNAFGSATGFMLLGIIAPSSNIGKGLFEFSPTSGGLGVLGGTGNTYEEAINRGLSETEARFASAISIPINASEGFGIGALMGKSLSTAERRTLLKFLSEYYNTPAGRAALRKEIYQGIKTTGKAASGELVEEGTQETYQGTGDATMWQYIEQRDKPLYDKIINSLRSLPRNAVKSLVEQGSVGMLTGGLLGGGMHHVSPMLSAEVHNDGTPQVDYTNSTIELNGQHFTFKEDGKESIEKWMHTRGQLEDLTRDIQKAHSDKDFDKRNVLLKEQYNLQIKEKLLRKSVEQVVTPVETSQADTGEGNQETAEPFQTGDKALWNGREVTVSNGNRVNFENETYISVKTEDGKIESVPITELQNRSDESAEATAPTVTDTTETTPVQSTSAVDETAAPAPAAASETTEKTEAAPTSGAKLSSTQLDIPAEVSQQIDTFAKNLIKPADVMSHAQGAPEYARDGFGGTKHTTVHYGLTDNNHSPVQELLKDEQPLTVTLGKTKVFYGKQNGKPYDVVYIEVNSPELGNLNKKIGDNLDTEGEFNANAYKPHITLAYVKAGKGRKYAGKSDFAGQTVTFNDLTFSPAVGDKVSIPLGTNSSVSAETGISTGETQTTAPTVGGKKGKKGKKKLEQNKETITPVPDPMPLSPEIADAEADVVHQYNTTPDVEVWQQPSEDFAKNYADDKVSEAELGTTSVLLEAEKQFIREQAHEEAKTVHATLTQIAVIQGAEVPANVLKEYPYLADIVKTVDEKVNRSAESSEATKPADIEAGDTAYLKNGQQVQIVSVKNGIAQVVQGNNFNETVNVPVKDLLVNDPMEQELLEARASHYSPNLFDKFDHSFMGAGEGAQVYGWGTYFFTTEEVGRYYKQQFDRRVGGLYWKGHSFSDGYRQAFLDELDADTKDSELSGWVIEAAVKAYKKFTNKKNYSADTYLDTVYKVMRGYEREAQVVSHINTEVKLYGIESVFDQMDGFKELTDAATSDYEYIVKPTGAAQYTERGYAAQLIYRDTGYTTTLGIFNTEEEALKRLLEERRKNTLPSRLIAPVEAYILKQGDDLRVRGAVRYNTELLPSEEEYLLLDEPFSGQSDIVKAALISLRDEKQNDIDTLKPNETFAQSPQGLITELNKFINPKAKSYRNEYNEFISTIATQYNEYITAFPTTIAAYPEIAEIVKSSWKKISLAVHPEVIGAGQPVSPQAFNDALNRINDIASAAQLALDSIIATADASESQAAEMAENLFSFVAEEVFKSRMILSHTEMESTGLSADNLRQLLEMKYGKKTTSLFLLSAGIKGNKYLDGNSRHKGEGTYNYVIFDENDIRIDEILFARMPDEMFAKYLPDIISNVRYVVEDFAGTKGLKLNANALELFNQAVDKNSLGFALSPVIFGKLKSGLKRLAKEHPAQAKQINKVLADVTQLQNDTNGYSYSYAEPSITADYGIKDVKGEEQFHRGQLLGAEGLIKEIHTTAFMNEVYEEMKMNGAHYFLTEIKGYPDRKHILVAEYVAQTANGDYEKFGLSEEDAVDLIMNAAEDMLENNPKMDFNYFKQINKLTNRVFGQLEEEYGQRVEADRRRIEGAERQDREDFQDSLEQGLAEGETARVDKGAASGKQDAAAGVIQSDVSDWDSPAYTKRRDAIPLEKNDEGKLLAPNGEVSNLQNEELWRTVRTPEFIAWFGDWLNNPKDASKVVDDNGEPRIAAHGTQSDFEVFDKAKLGSATTHPSAYWGFVSTPDTEYAGKSYASGGGGNVKQLFNNIRNPYYMSDAEYREMIPQGRNGSSFGAWNFKNNLDKNIDGIILSDRKGKVNEIFAFEPNQIKSIFNRGSFSENKDSILQAKKGTWMERVGDFLLSAMPTPTSVIDTDEGWGGEFKAKYDYYAAMYDATKRLTRDWSGNTGKMLLDSAVSVTGADEFNLQNLAKVPFEEAVEARVEQEYIEAVTNDFAARNIYEAYQDMVWHKMQQLREESLAPVMSNPVDRLYADGRYAQSDNLGSVGGIMSLEHTTSESASHAAAVKDLNTKFKNSFDYVIDKAFTNEAERALVSNYFNNVYEHSSSLDGMIQQVEELSGVTGIKEKFGSLYIAATALYDEYRRKYDAILLEEGFDFGSKSREDNLRKFSDAFVGKLAERNVSNYYDEAGSIDWDMSVAYENTSGRMTVYQVMDRHGELVYDDIEDPKRAEMFAGLIKGKYRIAIPSQDREQFMREYSAPAFQEAYEMLEAKQGDAPRPVYKPTEADKAFTELARLQRELPEDAMLRIQHAQIAQLYGWVAEHIGDLTHRMTEYPEHNKDSRGRMTVMDKVGKTLRVLTQSYGFYKEVSKQIESNASVHVEDNTDPKTYRGFHFTEAWQGSKELMRLGQIYADEHKKLPVYNEMQRAARDAAVAIGEFRFNDAIKELRILEDAVQNPVEWAQKAGEYDPSYESEMLEARRGVDRREYGVSKHVRKADDQAQAQTYEPENFTLNVTARASQFLADEDALLELINDMFDSNRTDLDINTVQSVMYAATKVLYRLADETEQLRTANAVGERHQDGTLITEEDVALKEQERLDWQEATQELAKRYGQVGAAIGISTQEANIEASPSTQYRIYNETKKRVSKPKELKTISDFDQKKKVIQEIMGDLITAIKGTAELIRQGRKEGKDVTGLEQRLQDLKNELIKVTSSQAQLSYEVKNFLKALQYADQNLMQKAGNIAYRLAHLPTGLLFMSVRFIVQNTVGGVVSAVNIGTARTASVIARKVGAGLGLEKDSEHQWFATLEKESLKDQLSIALTALTVPRFIGAKLRQKIFKGREFRANSIAGEMFLQVPELRDRLLGEAYATGHFDYQEADNMLTQRTLGYLEWFIEKGLTPARATEVATRNAAFVTTLESRLKSKGLKLTEVIEAGRVADLDKTDIANAMAVAKLQGFAFNPYEFNKFLNGDVKTDAWAKGTFNPLFDKVQRVTSRVPVLTGNALAFPKVIATIAYLNYRATPLPFFADVAQGRMRPSSLATWATSGVFLGIAAMLRALGGKGDDNRKYADWKTFKTKGMKQPVSIGNIPVIGFHYWLTYLMAGGDFKALDGIEAFTGLGLFKTPIYDLFEDVGSGDLYKYISHKAANTPIEPKTKEIVEFNLKHTGGSLVKGLFNFMQWFTPVDAAVRKLGGYNTAKELNPYNAPFYSEINKTVKFTESMLGEYPNKYKQNYKGEDKEARYWSELFGFPLVDEDRALPMETAAEKELKKLTDTATPADQTPAERNKTSLTSMIQRSYRLGLYGQGEEANKKVSELYDKYVTSGLLQPKDKAQFMAGLDKSTVATLADKVSPSDIDSLQYVVGNLATPKEKEELIPLYKDKFVRLEGEGAKNDKAALTNEVVNQREQGNNLPFANLPTTQQKQIEKKEGLNDRQAAFERLPASSKILRFNLSADLKEQAEYILFLERAKKELIQKKSRTAQEIETKDKIIDLLDRYYKEKSSRPAQEMQILNRIEADTAKALGN